MSFHFFPLPSSCNRRQVDHAGEFGANRIYAGQLDVLGKDPRWVGARNLPNDYDIFNTFLKKNIQAERDDPAHVGPGEGPPGYLRQAAAQVSGNVP